MSIDRTAQFFKGTLIAAGQTDAAVVSAVPGRKIRVMGVWAFPTTTPPATFQLNTKPSGGGTAISPVFPLVASVPFSVVGSADHGLFETNKSEGLTVTNPSGTTLAVFMLTYVVI